MRTPGKWLNIPLAFLLPVVLMAAEPPAQRAQEKGAKQAANAAARQTARQQAQAAQQALNAPRLPGGLTLQRLANMSPEELSTALGKLPPARRQQIAKRLEAYRNMTPDAQARVQSQLQRLEALPPERREQVRQSLMEFRDIVPPRRSVLLMEMSRLSAMTDAQRNASLNRPGFRARFSEAEILMMNNLRGIVP